jgi:hypothetical protein
MGILEVIIALLQDVRKEEWGNLPKVTVAGGEF